VGVEGPAEGGGRWEAGDEGLELSTTAEPGLAAAEGGDEVDAVVAGEVGLELVGVAGEDEREA
jgi:hypothetical protein